jgi:Rod binding domain-containing protein
MSREIAPIPSVDAQSSGAAAAWSDRLETARAANEAQVVSHDASVAQSAKGAVGADPKELARLRKVSQDFESLFLSYMMRVGRESGMKGGFMGQTQGEQIFTEMRDDELAKHMANAGGIGLSKLLVEQLTRTLQQQAQRQAAPVQD